MKQAYTLYIYRTDQRTTSGERIVSTSVWEGRDEAGMLRECAELRQLYPASKYRMEYWPRISNL